MKEVNPRRVNLLWKVKNLVYRGLYSHQLQPWLEHFTIGKDLMVVQFERMQVHPHAVMDEILDFLGVHRHQYDAAHFNESYSPVVGQEEHILNDATREYLLRLYEPYNEELIGILGEQWRNVWESGILLDWHGKTESRRRSTTTECFWNSNNLSSDTVE